MRTRLSILAGLAAMGVLALVAVPTLSTAADTSAPAGEYDPAQAKGYNAQQAKNMEAALPTEAYAKPAKPRKLLVYVESKGYYHASIPIVAAAIKGIGDKTGAWETSFGNDPAVFTPENLAKYDGVFMDNTVTEAPNTDAGKKALLDFVKGAGGGGKGFMACHAGADCNHKWDDYADLIGAEFMAHWWGVIKASNRIEDPTSPLVAMFPKEGFIAWEEIYTFKMPTPKKPQGYSRDKVHVLLSLDVVASKVDPAKGDFKDGDYALSWIKKYGDGRVFYTAYGHQVELMWSKPILKHYLAGIQYALGDLKADDTPSGKLDWKALHGPDPATTPLINPVAPAKN